MWTLKSLIIFLIPTPVDLLFSRRLIGVSRALDLVILGYSSIVS